MLTTLIYVDNAPISSTLQHSYDTRTAFSQVDTLGKREADILTKFEILNLGSLTSLIKSRAFITNSHQQYVAHSYV